MEATKTNSICFLCYKTSLRDKTQNGNYSSKTFIHILSKLLNQRPTLDVKMVLSRVDEVIDICDDCFGLGESMCQLYGHWELLNFKLDCRLREVCAVMRQADETFSSTLVNEQDAAGTGLAPIGVYRDIQNLRKELLKDNQKKSDSFSPSLDEDMSMKSQENGPVSKKRKHSAVPTVRNPFESSATNPIPFNCRRCPAQFDSHVLLIVHLRNDHDIKKRFKCHICGAIRLHPNTFREHMRQLHDTPSGLPGKFQCYICKEHFDNSQIRDCHLANTHKLYSHLSIERYVCNVEGCNKRLKTKQSLQIHSRMHTGETPYTCIWPGCGARFAYHGVRKLHYKKQHPNNNCCPNQISNRRKKRVSTKSLNQKNSTPQRQSTMSEPQQQQQQQQTTEQQRTISIRLQTPLVKKHPQTVVQRDAVPGLTCKICHASFSNREQLTTHQRVEHRHPHVGKFGHTPYSQALAKLPEYQACTPTNYMYPEIGRRNNNLTPTQQLLYQNILYANMNKETGLNMVQGGKTIADRKSSSGSEGSNRSLPIWTIRM